VSSLARSVEERHVDDLSPLEVHHPQVLARLQLEGEACLPGTTRSNTVFIIASPAVG
jgi:hypothetical protein